MSSMPAILLLYAYAGTIPVMIAPAYAGCGLTLVAINIALSEFGFNERFKDHYLVAPQATHVHGDRAGVHLGSRRKSA